MPVVALEPGYSSEIKDRAGLYHGNQLLYVGWDRHLMYCAPLCIPVPPDLPFRALIAQILPGLYAAHPDIARVDWTRVEWLRGTTPFVPDLDKSITGNGFGHKEVLRFRTPELEGIGGTHS
jgi:phenol/toluene 2-monooxygenase (NADH) P4/A4